MNRGPVLRMSLRSYETAVRSGFDELSRIQCANLDAATPYWQQGDEELETPEMIERRKALRQHPKVLETIEVWWGTAQRSLEQESHRKEGLSRERYILMSKKMYKAMMQDYVEEEALQSAADDWEEDAGSAPILSKDRFFDAIFELADLWTFEIDAQAQPHTTRAITARLLTGAPRVCPLARWAVAHARAPSCWHAQ